MKVLIAEDDEIYSTTLQIMFDEMQYETVKIVSNSFDLLLHLPTLNPDLLILDIHIEGDLDGIQLAEKVHEKNPYIPIIFITSSEDDVLFQRAKLIKPYAFLIKPFDEKVLKKTVELAFQYYKSYGNLEHSIYLPDSLFIKVKGILKKVRFDTIGYVEADEHYMTIVTKEHKYMTRFSLVELLTILPAQVFYYINRSTIINIQNIERIDLERDKIIIFEKEIICSRRKKQGFFEKMNEIGISIC